MGRLIDADALLQDIRENMPNYEVKKDFLLFVHAQPTAYDVDAVVAELEQKVNQYNRRERELVDKDTEAGIHNKGKACSYEHAIDIVKRGGVE